MKANDGRFDSVPNCKTDCYFAFGGAQRGDSLAAPGESSNESAGETLDVEGFDHSGGAGGLGLGVTAEGQQRSAVATASEGASASSPRQKPSRGIGIGIGVAAGAATVHRGMKRELSDSNLGAAGWDGNTSGWTGMGGDARRSMSEQQKLERRVRKLVLQRTGFSLCPLSSRAVDFGKSLLADTIHLFTTRTSLLPQVPKGKNPWNRYHFKRIKTEHCTVPSGGSRRDTCTSATFVAAGQCCLFCGFTCAIVPECSEYSPALMANNT